MPSRQKAKGNKFENDIVDFLNETYNTTEFHRTPNSGAMMGLSNWGKNKGLSKNVRRTLGSDLIVPDWFNFSVECKHYKDDPNYSQIIKGPDTKLDHWLAECLFDAINQDLHPLLFFKTNRQGTHFALPHYFDDALDFGYMSLYDKQYLVYGPFLISGIDAFGARAHHIVSKVNPETGDNEDVLSMRREDFFRSEAIKPYLQILEEENEPRSNSTPTNSTDSN